MHYPDFYVICREELNAYWGDLTAVSNVTDFLKHHHSESLRTFLDIDTILATVFLFTPTSINISFVPIFPCVLLDFIQGTSEVVESIDDSVVSSDSPKKAVSTRRNSTGYV
jgi:hypothetical protein